MGFIKNIEFIKNSIITIIGFGILIISNFIFNAVAGRLLEPIKFGIYVTFFYFLLGFTPPINSLQLAISKLTTSKSLNTNETINEVIPTLYKISIIILLIFIIISPLIKKLFNLKNYYDVIIGCFVIIIWLIMNSLRGIYQGKFEFNFYSFNIGIEGIIRTFIGIIFILLGFGISGAIGASIVSGIISILILVPNFYLLFPNFIKNKINNYLLKEFLNALVIILPFGMISSLDLIMIQYLIGGELSGYISTCGIFGKNLVNLSTVLASVVFPYTIKKKQSTFWIGMLITILIFIIFLIISIFLGNAIIYYIFGNKYLNSNKYLPLYILSMLPLGIMQHIVNYSIAKSIKQNIIILWILLIFLFIIYYYILKIFDLKLFLILQGIIILIFDFILLFFIFINNNKILDKNKI